MDTLPFNEKRCILTESIIKFATHNHWFSKQLRELRKLQEQTHKKGIMNSIRLAIQRLKKAIRSAKQEFRGKVELASVSRDSKEVLKILSTLINKGIIHTDLHGPSP